MYSKKDFIPGQFFRWRIATDEDFIYELILPDSGVETPNLGRSPLERRVYCETLLSTCGTIDIGSTGFIDLDTNRLIELLPNVNEKALRILYGKNK